MITEAQWQSQITDLAHFLHYEASHTHNSRFSEPGLPDLILVSEAQQRVIWAELKIGNKPLTKGRLSPRSKRLLPGQEDWVRILKACRQEVYIWRSGIDTLEEIAEILQGKGHRDVESIDESAAIGSTQVPISSFWKGKDFDELAAAQGVYPIDDLSKLSKDWPEDTDFDTFFDAVRSARD